MYDAGAVTGLPTYASLRAVREGREVTVLGEGWKAGDLFSTNWILTDLVVRAGEDGDGSASPKTGQMPVGAASGLPFRNGALVRGWWLVTQP